MSAHTPTSTPAETPTSDPIAQSAQRPAPITEVFKDRLGETADFPVRAGLTQLNNGSYGCAPVVVRAAQEHLQKRLEADPVRFFKRDLEFYCDDARRALAAFVGAPMTDLALVPNGTFAVSTILANLDLSPGDEILITDHEYMATMNELRRVCERTGASLSVAKLPFPEITEDLAVERILGAITPKTRYALLSHIASASAYVLPIERIIPELKAKGIKVIIDGAHAPGQLKLDIATLGCDWYAASCHKWLATPKGTGFVYAHPDVQKDFKPLALSCRVHEKRADRAAFLCDFDYVGTNDYSANLSIPVAIAHLGAQLPASEGKSGWDALYKRNHDLVLQGAAIIRDALGITAVPPESMTGSMVSIPIPGTVTKGRIYDDSLWDALYAKHHIQVPIWAIPNVYPRAMRISAQLFNTIEDYEKLAKALKAELG
jgi:isopenicillin-N epimerase